jgi:hypothetical protein
MEELIKKELFKNINAFLNEIELTMDYLDPQTVPSIKKYLKSIDKSEDEFKSFLEYTTHHLGSFESKISAVLFSNKKIKSDFYNFLDGVSLFSNILHFKVFENESKNTKKGMIKYLYSIYMSCVFLNQVDTNTQGDALQSKLAEFVEKIQKEAQDTLKEDDIKTPSSSSKTPLRHQRRNAISHPRSGPSSQPGLGDFDGIMESILGNKEILNIANDISQKMHSQQLNPMSMLSSLMTGNIENTPLQGLVEEIQQKVETKINNGEIDKSQLEEQAKTIIGSINSNPSALNSMPGMSDLINNMVKDMENQNKDKS